MRLGIIALMMACAFPAHAQYMGTLPPDLEAGFNYTTDSDKFSTRMLFVGGSIENGLGVRYTESWGSGNGMVIGSSGHYDAGTDTKTITPLRADKLHYTGHSLQLTYVNIGENYDFHGAFGPKQTKSYVSMADGSSASGSSTELVGDLDLRLTMTDSLTVGLTASRNTVDSAGNVIAGAVSSLVPVSTIMADTVAVDMDLQISDNLSMYKQVGITHFSNDNDRWFFNTKTTYTIMPDHGVSIYLRGKYQHDDRPTTNLPVTCIDTSPTDWQCLNAPYFSPTQRLGVLPGVQLRKSVDGLVYTAAVEYGRQWTTIDHATTADSLYAWQLGVQTQPGKKTGTTFAVDLFGSNASMTGSGGNYHWYGLYSWIKVPLQ